MIVSASSINTWFRGVIKARGVFSNPKTTTNTNQVQDSRKDIDLIVRQLGVQK